MNLSEHWPDLLTVQEVAEILRATPAQVTEFIKAGKIRHAEITGEILIPKQYIEKFIEENCKLCYDTDAEPIIPAPDGQEAQHLDNRIKLDCTPFQEGEYEMATKINRTVVVNGTRHGVHANTEQEYADKLAKLFNHVPAAPAEKAKHLFSDYALNCWFEIYSSPNIATVTSVTYKRQITKYLLPAFDGLNVEDITTDHVQRHGHRQGYQG